MLRSIHGDKGYMQCEGCRVASGLEGSRGASPGPAMRTMSRSY